MGAALYIVTHKRSSPADTYQPVEKVTVCVPGGWGAWTMLGGRENSKLEKYSKIATNPTCPVHALLG